MWPRRQKKHCYTCNLLSIIKVLRIIVTGKLSSYLLIRPRVEVHPPLHALCLAQNTVVKKNFTQVKRKQLKEWFIYKNQPMCEVCRDTEMTGWQHQTTYRVEISKGFNRTQSTWAYRQKEDLSEAALIQSLRWGWKQWPLIEVGIKSVVPCDAVLSSYFASLNLVYILVAVVVLSLNSLSLWRITTRLFWHFRHDLHSCLHFASALF